MKGIKKFTALDEPGNTTVSDKTTVDSFSELKIPDIGVGRMTTTTTRILMELMLETGTEERLEVLSSVIEYLGIDPEDFNRRRRNHERWGKLDYDNDELYSFHS